MQAYPVTWGVARNLNRVGNIYIFVKTKKDPRWQYSKLLPEGTKVNLMVARNKIASPWVIIFWFLVLSLFRGFCVVPDIYYIDMESIRTWSCMVSSFIVLLLLQWMICKLVCRDNLICCLLNSFYATCLCFLLRTTWSAIEASIYNS